MKRKKIISVISLILATFCLLTSFASCNRKIVIYGESESVDNQNENNSDKDTP